MLFDASSAFYKKSLVQGCVERQTNSGFAQITLKSPHLPRSYQRQHYTFGYKSKCAVAALRTSLCSLAVQSVCTGFIVSLVVSFPEIP